jgi:hypothetical protein
LSSRRHRLKRHARASDVSGRHASGRASATSEPKSRRRSPTSGVRTRVRQDQARQPTPVIRSRSRWRSRRPRVRARREASSRTAFSWDESSPPVRRIVKRQRVKGSSCLPMSRAMEQTKSRKRLRGVGAPCQRHRVGAGPRLSDEFSACLHDRDGSRCLVAFSAASCAGGCLGVEAGPFDAASALARVGWQPGVGCEPTLTPSSKRDRPNPP